MSVYQSSTQWCVSQSLAARLAICVLLCRFEGVGWGTKWRKHRLASLFRGIRSQAFPQASLSCFCLNCAVMIAAYWTSLLLWRQGLIALSCLLSVGQCLCSMLAIAGWTFQPPVVTWASQETKLSCCTQSWLSLAARRLHSWPVWFGSNCWTSLSVSIAWSKIASTLHHQHHFNDCYVVIKERFSLRIFGHLESCLVIQVFVQLDYDLLPDCASYDHLRLAWSLGWR